jgi:mono/diheme cytochrome c family protein
MTASPEVEEVGVFRTSAPMIALVSVVALTMMASPALAQTNIDQGKSPAELFANDCAACHKTTRGLANGRSTLTLSIFLREHYTASSDQAASLAAYVLNSGGNAPAPKPTAEHARTEEPKGQEHKGQEAKGQEPKVQEPKEARTPPPTAPQEPAPASATPAEPTEASGPTTSAAAHNESEPSENAPVPRDNIPD